MDRRWNRDEVNFRPAGDPRVNREGRAAAGEGFREERYDEGPGFHGESSVKDLISEFMGEAKRLVRSEVALARGDLKEEAKKLKKGGVSLAIGAGLAIAGGLTLCAFLVFLLALVMPLWASSLIVGALLVGIGAALALGGLKEIKSADPKKSIDRIEEDRQWLSSTAQEAKTARHSSVRQTPHASA